MKKGKRILSIMTVAAMVGLVFSYSFANTVTAYAKTNIKVDASGSIAKNIGISDKNNFKKDDFNAGNKFNKITLANKNNIINYNAPEFNTVASSSNSMATARLSGKTRYETAANIAETGWIHASDYAVIATGENFPDALCAAPLAAKYNAPIILTESSALNDNAKQELEKHYVKNVIIVGGVGAVSQNTENSIRALGIITTRISGKNRYETSEKIAEQVGSSSEIVMATGNDFPDALSIAGIAAMKGMPILLTDKNAIPAETLRYFNVNKAPITKTYVVGGTGVISDTVCKSLKNSQRLSGNNRYDTNKAITKFFNGDLNSGNIYIATGQNFPDALACSALAPLTCSPIILADSGLETAAQDYVTSNINSMGTVIAVGGTGAVPDTVLNNASGNYGKAYNNVVVASPFKDTYLEKVVRDTIKKPSGDFRRSDFNSITVLNARSYGIRDITGIDHLTNASSLFLGLGFDGQNVNSISDITSLKSLKRLKNLDLSASAPKDLSALKELTNLKAVNLALNNISDLSVLNGLTNLKQLILNGNSISDISALKGLTNLNVLELGCNRISDISALEGLTNLKSLCLCETNINNINSLKGLTNLETLDLSSNKLGDISELKGLANLKIFDLSSTGISDVSVLGKLTNLEILKLYDNKISEISTFNCLTNLRVLNIYNNNISDINALKGLTNLQNLNLSNNQISNISALKYLINLQQLYLYRNKISNEDITALIKALPQCKIYFN